MSRRGRGIYRCGHWSRKWSIIGTDWTALNPFPFFRQTPCTVYWPFPWKCPVLSLSGLTGTLENPDFKKTSKTIVKQMVNIRLVLEVTQYHADVYYNSKTGERIHAQFPAGVTDEVNYGESIKAFLFLLNNDCCTFRQCPSCPGSSNTSNQFSRAAAMSRRVWASSLSSSLILHSLFSTNISDKNHVKHCQNASICFSPDSSLIYS